MRDNSAARSSVFGSTISRAVRVLPSWKKACNASTAASRPTGFSFVAASVSPSSFRVFSWAAAISSSPNTVLRTSAGMRSMCNFTDITAGSLSANSVPGGISAFGSRFFASRAVTYADLFANRKYTGIGTFGTATSYTPSVGPFTSSDSRFFSRFANISSSATGSTITTGVLTTSGVTSAYPAIGRFGSIPSRPVFALVMARANATPCFACSPCPAMSPRYSPYSSRSFTERMRISTAGPTGSAAGANRAVASSATEASSLRMGPVSGSGTTSRVRGVLRRRGKGVNRPREFLSPRGPGCRPRRRQGARRG